MSNSVSSLSSSLAVAPCTLRAAREFIAQHHRHNRPPQGGLFAVGAVLGARTCAVAVVGRPVARLLDDGNTCEVVRLCTDGTPHAASLLYGACSRAAKALGWMRIITYTLASEPGTSLRASGWEKDASVRAEASWSRPSRHRFQADLFGEAQRSAEAKIRWQRRLGSRALAPTPPFP